MLFSLLVQLYEHEQLYKKLEIYISINYISLQLETMLRKGWHDELTQRV